MSFAWRTGFWIAVACCGSTLCFGQAMTGAISGRVIDPSGAGIANASIAAIEQNTNIRSDTTSDAQGAYTLPALRPGVFVLQVETTGFKRLLRGGVEVRVGDKLRIDLPMALGAVTESLDVTATAPLVESESSTLGAVINNREIVNLPLNTRNPFQLTLLTAGVTPASNFGNLFNTSADFSINGGRPNTNEILIDGISNSVPAANPIGVIAMFPSVDALQEFKVQTSTYSAEYGRSGGGIVNMIIRSGTNQLHGTAFEFLRNSVLDANSFFSNLAGSPLASFKRNQLGGTLGGAIVRDKLFFFVNYEGLRQSTQTSTTLTVPTAQQRAGDFSQTYQLVGGSCQPVQLYDPTTTRSAAGAGFVRDPFPGNGIPANRLDPAGRKIVTYFPLPSRPGTGCAGVNNYFSNLATPGNTDQMDMKFDWAPSSSHRVSAGLSWRTYATSTPNYFGSIATPGPINGDSIPSKAARIDYTRTFSPTVLLNLRFGVTRMERTDPSNASAGFSLADLGMAGNFESQTTQPISFPYITLAGYSAMGNSCCAFIFQAGTAYTYVANLTKIHGNHTIKFGLDYRVNQSFEKSGFNTSGNFAFTAGFTQGPDPNSPAANRGNSIASLLLGLGSGDVATLPGVLTSNRYMGLYVQDDYKVTRKLTLNLGLRYDLETGRTERFNQLSWFDFNASSPLAQQVGLPNLHGGEQFVGVNGNPRQQFNLDLNNIAPRFGFAYSMNDKTVVRGGYGIFYLPYTGQASGTASGINGFLADTQWVSSLNGLNPNYYLSNPFPNGLNNVTAPGSGLATNIGQNIGATSRDGAIDRGARVGYMQQWDLNIQRQITSTLVLEAAYAGSKGTKLPDTTGGVQLDQLTGQQLQAGTALQQLVTNPFYGHVATGVLSQPTVTQGQLLRPYPQFVGLQDYRPDLSSSIYHAVQARLEKRFSSGLSLMVAFTGAKLIDESSGSLIDGSPAHQDSYNLRLDRSVSAQDVSRRLVVSSTYALPLGRGQRFGTRWPRLLDAVAGNWAVNGIATYSTGLPLAITNAQNNSNSFSNVQRPNISGDAMLSGGRSTQEKLAQWFNTAVFTQPAAFKFGAAPRVLPNVRRDGVRNGDFSLFKEFKFSERVRSELRGEFFNIFNTPQFAAPGTSFGTSTFGVVSAQANTPRQVQLGLKVHF